MNDATALLNTVIQRTTGRPNPFSLESAQNKFAFDVRLPEPVVDALTSKTTWAQSTAPDKFVDMATVRNSPDGFWMQKQVFPTSLSQLLQQWAEINYTAASRHIESLDVNESDNIYFSQSVHRSIDITRSKNILWCDGVMDSEYMVASQRSHKCQFGLRIEDSKECSESIGVTWSDKIVRSAFIHNCSDMYESLFCSHLVGMRFCIANMQFGEDDYFKLKRAVMSWVLQP